MPCGLANRKSVCGIWRRRACSRTSCEGDAAADHVGVHEMRPTRSIGHVASKPRSWWSAQQKERAPDQKVGLPEGRVELVERYMIDADEALVRAQQAADEQTQHEAAEELAKEIATLA